MCNVMGIVNVTPDSFSDGGQFFKPEEAIRRAKNLVADGADIIDFGGESTRPGATPIGWEEEWSRIEPVLAGLASSVSRLKSCKISIDTYHPETAERAIKAGADIINCVYAEPVAEMLKLLNGNDVELVVPYRKSGEAESFPLQDMEESSFSGSGKDSASPLMDRIYLDPMIGLNTTREEDIELLRSIPELLKLLAGNDVELVVPYRLGGEDFSRETLAADIADRLYFDPMIGFNTTREEDVALLRSIPELAMKGRVLVGASRKRVVKKLVGEKGSVGKNVGGNVAIAVWAAMNGASVVRVHDVKETVQALRVIGCLEGEEEPK